MKDDNSNAMSGAMRAATERDMRDATAVALFCKCTSSLFCVASVACQTAQNMPTTIAPTKANAI
jgi:hypothetical protein